MLTLAGYLSVRWRTHPELMRAKRGLHAQRMDRLPGRSKVFASARTVVTQASTLAYLHRPTDETVSAAKARRFRSGRRD